MTVPRGTSYEAEIMRVVHDNHDGELRDSEYGITARLWDEIGQLGGCHKNSLASALTRLETRGSICTDFGTRSIDGKRCRVGIMIFEEPPEGTTVYKPRRPVHREDHYDEIAHDPERPPAEQIAAALLRMTLEAATVPVSDIKAMQRHIECLLEDMQVSEELLDEANQEIISLTRIIEQGQRDVDRLTRNHQVESRNWQKATEGLRRELAAVQEKYQSALQAIADNPSRMLNLALEASEEKMLDMITQAVRKSPKGGDKT